MKNLTPVTLALELPSLPRQSISLLVQPLILLPLMSLPAHAENTEPNQTHSHTHNHADTHSADSEQPLEEVLVKQAAPSSSELTSEWMGAEELAGNRNKALGEVMEAIPGVSNASFGQGVARPMVRGLSGNRVEILNGGSDAADLSSLSADHAPMVDLAAADGVELLRGPLALRQGNSSLGGVVNVLSGRIHDVEFDGVSGSATAGYSTNNNGKTLIARMDAGNGRNVLHIDGFTRTTDNYHAGTGGARSGEVINSDTDAAGAAIAYSHIFNYTDYVGISASRLTSDYAIPNEDNDDLRVKPEQNRYDFKGNIGLNGGLLADIFTDFSWHASYADYEHGELEGDTVAGLFLQDFADLQTELAWSGLAGWLSGWEGHLGLGANWRELQLCHDHSGCDDVPDFSDAEWDGTEGSDFYSYEGGSFAHDTPMPITQSRDIIAYVTASGELELNGRYIGQLDLAARYQPRHIEADPTNIRVNYRRAASYYDDRDFHPLTLSAALTTDVNDSSTLTTTLSRVQRAPVADEIYWNGDHHAIFAFQLDNPNLKTETAYAIDLSWQGQSDRSDWRIATYLYEYDGYIYNELQSYRDPFHGRHVYKHMQADARLAGLEASWLYQLSDNWETHLKAATSRGWLTDGGDPLPRLPADNVSQSVQYRYDGGSLNAEWQLHLRQTRLADAETETPSWYQLNLSWSQQLGSDLDAPQLMLKATNITDQYGKQHTTTLKDYAPVMGRNVSLELTVPFG